MKALELAQQLIRLTLMHGNIECEISLDMQNGETTNAAVKSAHADDSVIEIYGEVK